MRHKTLAALTALLLAVTLPLVGGCGGDSAEEEDQAALTFIQFYDPECPFCQEMEPIVEDLRKEYEPRIESFEIINVTTPEGKDKVEEFGVFITPTFVLLDGNGDELDRINGAAKKDDMIAFIDRGIDDVSGEKSSGPRDTIEGEGTELEGFEEQGTE